MQIQDRERVEVLRSQAQALRDRAGLLCDDERALVEALLEHGHSMRALARLMGLWPSTLRRRLDRVVTRMASPKFTFFAARMPGLSHARRRVGRACVLHGMSLRRASRELRMSHHTIRRHVDALHAMFEAAA
jgi:lambda repressor-like predicted transcriptional regulator